MEAGGVPDVTISKAAGLKLQQTLGKKHNALGTGSSSSSSAIRRSSLAQFVFGSAASAGSSLGGGQSGSGVSTGTVGPDPNEFTLGFPNESACCVATPNAFSIQATVAFRALSPNNFQLRRGDYKYRSSIVDSHSTHSTPNRRASAVDTQNGADLAEALSTAVARELEQSGAGGGIRTSHSNFLRPPKTTMGRVMRVVVAGGKRVGKTAIMHQLACLQDITNKPYFPTIDDTYQIHMDQSNEKPKEILVFHDTGGISEIGPVELRKPYIQVADAFLLVYSVADPESFNRMDLLKKYLDKQFGKDKKEVPIVVLGNMCDLPGQRKVDTEFAQSWANREKVKLYEVSAKDRTTLLDFVHYLAARYFHPPKESKFSLSKKLKPEKANAAAIVMDI